VSPNSNLNKAGGEVLTITGSGFPSGMYTDHDVVVSFSDGTKCRITSMTSSEIKCETEPFETYLRRNRRELFTETGISISINSASSSSFDGLTLLETDVTVDSITPNSASPILVETLLIQLSSTYDNTDMDTDRFLVSIYP
jgi:hypothetical protein